MSIKGLPEGIEAVRIGIAGPDEVEILNTPDPNEAPLLVKGPRPGSSTQIIVKPAQGYRFEPIRHFDIKSYQMVEGIGLRLVKVLPQPREITATVKFRVDSEQDTKAVEDAIAALRTLPGYVAE